MKFKALYIVLLFSTFFLNAQESEVLYQSEDLSIKKLTDHTYMHISFLETKKYGKVSCNGMIIIDQSEAIVFDTPANEKAAEELIHWIEKDKESQIKAIVPTHFHYDCLGGISAFHKKKIPSYANELTIELAKEDSVELPLFGFYTKKTFLIGDHEVVAQFFGAGHSPDNIIAYYEKDQALFGGCLIKALGVNEGNLLDAKPAEWSETVNKIKENYPKLKYVIPGHGKVGTTDLLDYTIKMFK